MIYFDVDSLEAFTGFATRDFKDGGDYMTATAWGQFVATLDKAISSFMHRYCGVETLAIHYVEELHDGRSSWSNIRSDQTAEDLILRDTTFFLRDHVAASATVDVKVDAASITEPPSWSQRYVRGTATGGDYIYQKDGDLGMVIFTKNIPVSGPQKVKISYWSGFAEGSDDMEQIKLVAKRMATNLLLLKKKIQEAQTIRATAVKDYSQMFDLEIDKKIFTQEIEMNLMKYRRYQFGGGGFI